MRIQSILQKEFEKTKLLNFLENLLDLNRRIKQLNSQKIVIWSNLGNIYYDEKTNFESRSHKLNFSSAVLFLNANPFNFFFLPKIYAIITQEILSVLF